MNVDIILPMGPEGLRLVKPMQLFHATVASSAVLESGGLRSREDLGGLNMTGGGPDKSISMTGDIRVAEAVVLALVTTCRIAQDEITASELLDAFRRISPRGHSNFVSQKNAYKDIKNARFKGYDLFNLYRDILMFGNVFDQTVYDPVLVSTDLSFFDAPSEDLINNICVLSCDLSTRARIVPRNHRFRQLPGQLNYVQFPVDESNIVRGKTSSGWGDFRYKDGVSEYLFRGAQGHSLAVEIVHEPITGPVRTNVSYLEQMDEFRVWDSSLLSNYVEGECGPDILERIQDRTGQDVFYPYFKELTIEDNLIRSQLFRKEEQDPRSNPSRDEAVLVIGTTEIEGYTLTWVTSEACNPEYTSTDVLSKVKSLDFEGVDDDSPETEIAGIARVVDTFEDHEHSISRLLKETGLEENTVIVLSPSSYDIPLSEYPSPEHMHLVFVECGKPDFEDPNQLLRHLSKELFRIANVPMPLRRSKEWASFVTQGADLTSFFNGLRNAPPQPEWFVNRYARQKGQFYRGESTKGAGTGVGYFGAGLYLTDIESQAKAYALLNDRPEGRILTYHVPSNVRLLDADSAEWRNIRAELGIRQDVITDPNLLTQLRKSAMNKGYDGVASQDPEKGFVIFDPEGVGVQLIDSKIVTY